MIEILESATYLGPARVLAAKGRRVKIELPDEHVWAVVALGTAYEIAVDDVVLAIGREGTYYVIGLIEGHGKTTLTVPGDLELNAPRGAIAMSAANGISLKSSDVNIAATRFEVVAKTVFEQFKNATRWVAEALHLRVGRVRMSVAGEYDLTADRILQRADRDVKIDGEKIHLG